MIFPLLQRNGAAEAAISAGSLLMPANVMVFVPDFTTPQDATDITISMTTGNGTTHRNFIRNM